MRTHARLHCGRLTVRERHNQGVLLTARPGPFRAIGRLWPWLPLQARDGRASCDRSRPLRRSHRSRRRVTRIRSCRRLTRQAHFRTTTGEFNYDSPGHATNFVGACCKPFRSCKRLGEQVRRAIDPLPTSIAAHQKRSNSSAPTPTVTQYQANGCNADVSWRLK